jgi:SPOR domain
MKKNEIIVFGIAIMLLQLAGCSSSQTGRNGTAKESSNESELAANKLNENFDLTPYHEQINISEVSQSSDINKFDIWYSYPQTDTSKIDSSSFVSVLEPGYRVVVLSTDDLQKANELKSELYFKTNQKNIYLDFEPPFYKVKIGDFTSLHEANNLIFKLNQLGYKDARVISEDVNVVKQQ